MVDLDIVIGAIIRGDTGCKLRYRRFVTSHTTLRPQVQKASRTLRRDVTRLCWQLWQLTLCPPPHHPN